MRYCGGYLVFISILLYQTVLSFNNLTDDFKNVDSDFDLEQAIMDFKIEDYENIKDFAHSGELGPGPAKGSNRSSAEIMKLLQTGQALIDTSGEKEMQKLRRLIIEKDKEETRIKNATSNEPEGKKRVKRQGKFEEASKVDNTQTLRIYLTMIKNLYARNPIGGVHPLHKDVPKPICILFKDRIMRFLFPPVGDEKKV